MLLELLIVVAVLAAVAAALAGPLRRARADGGEGAPNGADELRAARDAKYREIRDAELDYRTGKLSEPDWRDLDAGLRAEAVEILRALDRAGGGDPDAAGRAGDPDARA